MFERDLDFSPSTEIDLYHATTEMVPAGSDAARLYAAKAKDAFLAGNFAEAASLMVSNAALYRDTGDPLNVAWCLNNLGKVYYRLEALSDSRAVLDESISLFSELDDSFALSWALYNLGRTLSRSQEYDIALDTFERSLEHFRQGTDVLGTAYALNAVARTAYRARRLNKAAEASQESLRLFQHLDDHKGIAWSYELLAKVAYRMDELEEARNYYEQALEAYGHLDIKDGVGWVLLALGKIDYREKRFVDAIEHLQHGKTICLQHGNNFMAACAVEHLSRIAYKHDDFARAEELIREAIFLFSQVPDHAAVSDLNVKLVRVMQANSEHRESPSGVQWSGPHSRQNSASIRVPVSRILSKSPGWTTKTKQPPRYSGGC